MNKNLFASPTFWATIVLIISSILNYFGFAVTDTDKAEMATHLSMLVNSICGLVILWRKIKSSKVLVILLLPLFAITACAVTSAETASQKVYALQADFNIAQAAAFAYVSSPSADTDIKRNVQRLEAIAYASVKAAQKAVVMGDAPAVPALLSAGKTAVFEFSDYLIEKGILK